MAAGKITYGRVNFEFAFIELPMRTGRRGWNSSPARRMEKLH